MRIDAALETGRNRIETGKGQAPGHRLHRFRITMVWLATRILGPDRTASQPRSANVRVAGDTTKMEIGLFSE